MEIEIFFAKYDDNNDSTFYTSDVVEALGDIDQKEQEGDENLLDQSRWGERTIHFCCDPTRTLKTSVGVVFRRRLRV